MREVNSAIAPRNLQRLRRLGLLLVFEAREQDRCSAYFDAMWYAHLMKQDANARHYHERMLEIGNFHCGLPLAFASGMNP